MGLMSLIFCSSLSASNASISLSNQKQPLPSALYDEAWPGAAYFLSLDQEALEQAKIKARTLTRETADREGWSENKRRAWDWIYAVDSAEQLILSKPFDLWNVNYLKLLAMRATRLTAEKPGAYRKEMHGIFVKNVAPEERAKLIALIEKAHLAPDEQAYVAEHFFSFPAPNQEPPHDFDTILSVGLKHCQESLKKDSEESNQTKKELRILATAASIAFELSRLAPFERYSDDIGRLIMNIILAQHQLPIMRYPSTADYNSTLIASIKTGNPHSFWTYTTDLYLLMQQLDKGAERSGNEHSEIFAEAPGILSTDMSDARTLGNLRKKLEGLLRSIVFSCGYCQKEGAQKICSRCKEIAYCSPECQNSHWKEHRSLCKQKGV